MKNIWKEGKVTTIIGVVITAVAGSGLIDQYPILKQALTFIGGALVTSKDPKQKGDKYQPEI